MNTHVHTTVPAKTASVERMRPLIAALVENLIAVLDEIDGDENMEDNADPEPYLGWPNGHGVPQLDKNMAHDDDREADEDPGEDDDPPEDNGDREDDPAVHDAPGFIPGGQGI